MPSDEPSERVLQALRDMQDNAILARQFVDGLDEAAFAADLRTLYAVVLPGDHLGGQPADRCSDAGEPP